MKPVGEHLRRPPDPEHVHDRPVNELAPAHRLGERIQAAEVVIPMRVGENNKLYGSVTAHSIGEALDALGLSVDRRRILLDSNIRTLGTHMVRVRLHADVVIELPVNVVAERAVDSGEAPVEEAAKAPVEEPVAE